MDEQLGSAAVEITATLGPLENGLNQAKQQVESSTAQMSADAAKLSDSFTISAEGIRTALETLGISLGVHELISGIQELAESGARLQEVADAVGLTSRQLQVFQFAAQQAGIEQEKFNANLEIFSRNIGLIATGQATPAAKAFAELGISIKDTNGNILPTSQILEEVLTKLNGVSDATIRAAQATEIFGRGGREMGNVAREVGEQGLAELTKRAEESGQVMSPGMTEKAKQLNDSFKLLSNAIKNDLITGLIQLKEQGEVQFGWLEKIPGLIKQAAEGIEHWISPDVHTQIETLTADIEKLKEELKSAPDSQVLKDAVGMKEQKRAALQLQLESGGTPAPEPVFPASAPVGPAVVDPKVAEAQKKLQEEFAKTTATLADQAAGYQRLADAAGHGTQAMRDAATVTEIQNELSKFSGQLTAQQVQQIEALVIKKHEEKAAVEDAARATKEAQKAADDDIKAYEKLIGESDHLSAKQREIADELGKVEHGFQAGTITAEQYNQALIAAHKELLAANKDTAEQMRVTNDLIAHGAESIARGFVDAGTNILKGKDALQEFGNAAVNVLNQIEQMIIELLIIEPLMKALKASLDSSGGVSGLFGFASGGSFDVGGGGGVDSQLVMFKATPGEHVSVGQNDRGPASGQSRTDVNVIVNNHSGEKASYEERRNTAGGKDIVVQIGEAMAQDVAQGGPLSRSIGRTFSAQRAPIQR
jgi:hypothetical protein